MLRVRCTVGDGPIIPEPNPNPLSKCLLTPFFLVLVLPLCRETLLRKSTTFTSISLCLSSRLSSPFVPLLTRHPDPHNLSHLSILGIVTSILRGTPDGILPYYSYREGSFWEILSVRCPRTFYTPLPTPTVDRNVTVTPVVRSTDGLTSRRVSINGSNGVCRVNRTHNPTG